jgi:hypothetical protein
MAPSDLADRLAFLFPTTYCPGATTPDAPDLGDHDALRHLVSLELRLPTAANEVEARALSTFVDLRSFFAYAVLRDTAGAWQAVLRLLDEGHDRDEVLEEINDVLSEHVLEPMTSGAEVDVGRVHAAFDRLGRWDPLDDELEHLPWMIDEWRSSGSVADDEVARIVREVIHPEVLQVIGDEVRTVDEVAARFSGRLRLPEADATAVVGMYLEWFTNAVVVTPRGNVARWATVLDGVRFRHVLTEAEAACERVEVATDLAVVFDDIDALRLPDGSPLQSTYRTAVDGPENRRGEVHVVGGPPGWLDGVHAGDQIAISRRGDQIVVEQAEPADAPAHVVSALRASQDELPLPTDVYRLVGVAAVDAGGFGADLGAPLSELLELAGWSVRGDELAAKPRQVVAGNRRQLARPAQDDPQRSGWCPDHDVLGPVLADLRCLGRGAPQRRVRRLDDMLGTAAELIAHGFDPGYDLVLVDEFQDSSQARRRLVQELVAPPGRFLMTVGDDWQAINRFAGADLSVMTSFHERFGPGPQLALATTFRCTQTICDVASQFVSRNRHQFDKSMRSVNQRDRGAPVEVAYSEDPAGAVAACLRRWSDEAGPDGATVFVLGRYNFERRDSLRRRSRTTFESTSSRSTRRRARRPTTS